MRLTQKQCFEPITFSAPMGSSVTGYRHAQHGQPGFAKSFQKHKSPLESGLQWWLSILRPETLTRALWPGHGPERPYAS